MSDITVDLIDHMGSDLSVVNAARVSFAKESKLVERDMFEPTGQVCQWWIDGGSHHVLSEADQKLIGYLAKHNHWSPFAHAFLSFRIKAPIFVARQLVKHQVGLSWNEESRRYISDNPEMYEPTEWRRAPEGSIKQGSGEVHEDSKELSLNLSWANDKALAIYYSMLHMGVAPEMARMVLPLNTMTQWIWSGSLMAFMRVVNLRLDPHAQRETAHVAALISEEVKHLFPASYEALRGTSD